jgi:hypothetical protein
MQPWNEEVYYVQGAYKSYGGFYAWGNTIAEALENAHRQGAHEGCKYRLLKIKGEFTVSHIDGCITYDSKDGWVKELVPARPWRNNRRKELAALEKLIASQETA